MSNIKGFEGLYFDGRKDKTMIIRKEGTRFHRRSVIEEHLSLISDRIPRILVM